MYIILFITYSFLAYKSQIFREIYFLREINSCKKFRINSLILEFSNK